MKTISMTLLVLCFIVISGCALDEIERGKIDKNGMVLYHLCERGKHQMA